MSATTPGPEPLNFRRAIDSLPPLPPIDATPEAVARANAEERAWAWASFLATLKRHGWSALFAGIGTAASVLLVGLGWAVYTLLEDRKAASTNAARRGAALVAWRGAGAEAPAGGGEGSPAAPLALPEYPGSMSGAEWETAGGHYIRPDGMIVPPAGRDGSADEVSQLEDRRIAGGGSL